MPYQNISAVLSDADRDTILTKINEIKALMPFLVNLTPEERSTMLKMGDKSVAFVGKALGYAKNNANLIPPYLNVPELEKDFALAQKLEPIVDALDQLWEGVNDTAMGLGSESFSAALIFMNTAKNAAKSNVPGTDAIYSDLKTRFPGRIKGTSPQPVNP